MKKYRNEWKYRCTNCDLQLLQNRLQGILSVDSHSNENGMYYIHSLYFDDYKCMCLKNTEAGVSKRFKWRIRYYGNDNNNILLERKEKLNGMCHKKSCKITIDEYNIILSGDVSQLIWTTKKELLKRFCVDILTKNFSPKVIIDYERIAYVEPITNIRITLDTNISASYDFDNFLSHEYQNFPLQNRDDHILEVKFDYILPSYIRNIVCSYGFKQTSFSKYSNGMKKLDEVLR